MTKAAAARRAIAGYLKAAAMAALVILGGCQSGHAAALPELETVTSARLLRSWPRAGAWFTAMVRTSSNELACYMASAPIAHSSPVVAGLRMAGDALAIEIVAGRRPRPSGDVIAIVVDGGEVGRYQVASRLRGLGYSTVLAPVPADARQPLVDAISSGRTITFVSGKRRVTTSLAHADLAWATLRTCAASLPNGRASQKGQPREVIMGQTACTAAPRWNIDRTWSCFIS